MTRRAKLTAYLGERDRTGHAFTAEALLDLYERHGIELSVLLRGAEGFGLKHHLHTDRLLTLSEALPVVAVAVDEAGRIESIAPHVKALAPGLLTLEGVAEEPPPLARLTIYAGRREAPALAAGLPNATVLLGVDGTRRGTRTRGRFLSANAGVTALVVAIGPGAELAERARDHLYTLERVTICDSDPPPVPTGQHQKVTIYAESPELVPRLRAAGAAGATALRGYGDRFWSLRRRVPTVTIVVDEPERVTRWWPAIHTGLVTSEPVRIL